MSFVSALPAQQILFKSVLQFIIRTSDLATGLELAKLWRTIVSGDTASGLELANKIMQLLDKAHGVEVSLVYIPKYSSDLGHGIDISRIKTVSTHIVGETTLTVAGRTIIYVLGVPLVYVSDGCVIEPEDHNLQVDACLKIRKMLEEMGLL